MSADVSFTKENLDDCLRALGKEFRRLNGKKMPAEIVLVGGAAVLANYGFRDMTYDIDAVIHASSAMKDAINNVGDSLDLPNGWLNSDFMRTKSYTPKLAQYSVYYKTFSNILTVRTVSGEYLIAMKLMSGRQYKNDISDIIGILHEQKESGRPIVMTAIDKAVRNLYGGWENMPEEAKNLAKNILSGDNIEQLYRKYREEEEHAKEILIEFERVHPQEAAGMDLNEILAMLKERGEEVTSDTKRKI